MNKVINYYENDAFKVRGQSEGPNECLPEVKPPEQSEQGIDCDEFDAIKNIVFLQGFP